MGSKGRLALRAWLEWVRKVEALVLSPSVHSRELRAPILSKGPVRICNGPSALLGQYKPSRTNHNNHGTNLRIPRAVVIVMADLLSRVLSQLLYLR